MQPPSLKVPTLTILSHPDSRRVGEKALLWASDAAQGEAELSRWSLDFAPVDGGDPRPLDDPYLSRRPIRFTAARFGGIRLDCSQSGTRVVAADDWISEDRVFLGVEVERGVVLVLAERLALLLHREDPQAVGEQAPRFGLVGDSSSMLRLRREIRGLAGEAHPVLVRGGVGSGKKRVARALHEARCGQDRPCVTVDLHRVPSPLDVLSAFLERAHGGTLVFDDVERLDTGLQSRILECLHDRLPSLDSTRILVVGDLDTDSGKTGPLIDDLAPRTIEIPALRQRRDDIGSLVFHFLHDELGRLEALHRLGDPGPFAPPWFPARLAASLAAYDWPRNIRQLERVTRRLALEYHDRDHVDIGNELEALLEGPPAADWDVAVGDDAGTKVERDPAEISEIELLAALRTHRWQAEPTAEHLGVSPERLFEMIENFSEKSQRRRARPRRRNPGPI